MNIFGLWTKDSEFKRISELYYKKDKKLDIAEDYYEGKHWKKGLEWIETRAGVRVIDKPKTDKNYIGIILNYIKDSVDTMNNLVVWIEGVKSNISEYKEEVNSKITDLTYELANSLNIYKEWWIELLNKEGKIEISFVDPECIIEEGDYIYRIYERKDKVMSIDKVWYSNDWIDEEGNMYKGVNWQTITETGEGEIILVKDGIIPFYRFKSCSSIVEDMIKIQDPINIMATQEFEINKYQGAPAFAFRNVSPVDAWWKALNPNDLSVSESNILFLGQDWSAERIGAGSVTQEFRQAFEYLVASLYKTAKLAGLKNEDIGSVTSGHAIELKLMDTIAYVNKIRKIIEEWFEKVFKDIEYILGIEEGIIKIEFSDSISKDIRNGLEEMQLKIEMADKMKYIGVPQEFLWKFVWFKEEEIEEIKRMKEEMKGEIKEEIEEKTI